MSIEQTEVVSNADKVVAWFVNDADILSKNLLFESQYMKKLDNEALDKYVIGLEKALKPNKRVFPKSISAMNQKYNVIDEIYVQICDFPRIISEVKISILTEEWPGLCDTCASPLIHCDAILEMLAKNVSLPLKNNESLSGGRKKRFSFGVIYGLIIDEIANVGHSDAKILRTLVDEMLDLLLNIINIGWNSNTKKVTIFGTKPHSMFSTNPSSMFRTNLKSMIQIVEMIERQLKNMSNKGIISNEKCYTLIHLVYSIDYIPHIFIEYRNLIKSFETEDKDSILRTFNSYVVAANGITTHSFHLAIRPGKMNIFIRMIEPRYSKIKGIMSGLNQKRMFTHVKASHSNQNNQLSDGSGVIVITIIIFIAVCFILLYACEKLTKIY